MRDALTGQGCDCAYVSQFLLSWPCHVQLCGKAASGIAVWTNWRTACLIIRNLFSRIRLRCQAVCVEVHIVGMIGSATADAAV